MNIQKIREIVNKTDIPATAIEAELIEELAKDEYAINIVLRLLSQERACKKELVTNLNLLLSKSYVAMRDPQFLTYERVREIKEFYQKNGQVENCFVAREDL